MTDGSRVLEYKVAMTCEGCSNQVSRVLTKAKDNGVENFEIDLENQKVTVTSTLPPEEVLDILKKTGKTVEFIGIANN
ncbi:copper transport protein ATOX1-like [Agrilus planipennis]|uniref:Copper transport protein ATOX1 n=1 Tax=Agrilus planipennis TaxID=224129 RepID=A0A1W4XV41_AGRPL|nr:copper transport protein ATOX1-like [Agrilus planipennis]